MLSHMRPGTSTSQGVSLGGVTMPLTARIVLPCLALALGACADLLDPPPDERVPVIQALLVAGQDTQSLWVEWSTPADSVYRPPVRAIDPAQVDLRLQAPDGTATPFLPSPGTPGRFVAQVRVQSELGYGLVGVVADSTVGARTTVPARLRILSPATDTVLLRDGESVPFVWGQVGAASYAMRVSAGYRADYRTDTSRVIGPCPRATCVWTVLALDTAAAAFLIVNEYSTAPLPRRGNVRGALGFFGSATADSRVVVWQP